MFGDSYKPALTVCRLDIARDEEMQHRYPKRIILVRHGEVSSLPYHIPNSTHDLIY